MSFKCHDCGTAYQNKGNCKDCGKTLERTCPTCGHGREFCTCETPSTKAHKPR